MLQLRAVTPWVKTDSALTPSISDHQLLWSVAMVGVAVVVGTSATLLAPVALAAAGFGSAGVVAGSLAAGWQASIGEPGQTLSLSLSNICR